MDDQRHPGSVFIRRVSTARSQAGAPIMLDVWIRVEETELRVPIEGNRIAALDGLLERLYEELKPHIEPFTKRLGEDLERF